MHAGGRGREGRLWRLVSGVVVAASGVMACTYVDPQCLLPGFGHSAVREHGVLLQSSFILKFKRYSDAFSLTVDGAGGVEYSEGYGELQTCRRLGEGQEGALADLWTKNVIGQSVPRCGPGYEFRRWDDQGACQDDRGQWVRRRRDFLPYAEMRYYADEGPVSFFWDLESELPEELEAAFADSLGLLCVESRRLARNLRRSVPELAARAGCLSAGP